MFSRSLRREFKLPDRNEANQFLTITVLKREKYLYSDEPSHIPVWVVEGDLTAKAKDPFETNTTAFKWGFRCIVKMTEHGRYIPLEFKCEDSHGSYSTFIRALVWEHLRFCL